MAIDTQALGGVTVWAKGFRVSHDSDEFQRVVPLRAQDLSLGVERDLDSLQSWASVLEALYKLSEYELSSQRCLIVRPDEVAVVAAGASEDKHGRPTRVLVCVASKADWTSSTLAAIVASSSALAGRLAVSYAANFRRNPVDVLKQLQASTFVSDRQFEILFERAQETIDWPAVMNTVKAWRGIRGVSTSKLVGLGANIFIGTQHEADRAGVRLDGVIDTKDWSLTPLNQNVTRWNDVTVRPTAPVVREEPDPSPESRTYERLESIDSSLRRIDDSLLRISQTFANIYDHFWRFWSPKGGPPKR
jgi:hypothetical protein